MLSDLQLIFLRQLREEVIISQNKVTVYPIAGVLTDPSFTAFCIAKVNQNVYHADFLQYGLNVLISLMRITHDDNALKGLLRRSSLLSGRNPILTKNLFQKFLHFPKCFAAMTDRIFFFRRQFRTGFSVFRKIQNRIVAETVFTGWLFGNQTFKQTFGMENTAIGEGGTYITGEMRSALLPFRMSEFMNDSGVFDIIGSIFAQVPCRIYSGKSEHIVYTETGVIGHDDIIILKHVMSLHIVTYAYRFQFRILRKGFTGFNRFKINAKLTFCNDFRSNIL